MPRHGLESLDASLALEAAKTQPVPPGGGRNRAWLRIGFIVTAIAILILALLVLLR